MKRSYGRALVFCVMGLLFSSSTAFAASAFTYQGRLNVSGFPANGVYDLQFRLFDAPTDGTQIGSTVAFNNLSAVKGLFSATLDFGTMAFNGAPRYLQISVREGTSSAAFTTLQPRQEILPTPYAIHAQRSEMLGDSLATADNVAGIVRLNDAGLISLDSGMNQRVGLGIFSNGESGLATWGPNGSLNLDLTSPANNLDFGYIGVADDRGVAQAELGILDSGEGALNLWGPSDEVNVEISSGGTPDSGFVGVASGASQLKSAMGVLDDGEGYLATLGPNGNINVDISSMTNLPNNGFVGVANSSGVIQAAIYVDSSGNGIVFGDQKAFVADHPKKPGEKIVYISLEGPESGIYDRGTVTLVRGRAVIQLPEHFAALAQGESLTVQLTPASFDSKGLGYQLLDGSQIEVRELQNGQGNYDVSYLVQARRSDIKQIPSTMSQTEFEARFQTDRTRTQIKPKQTLQNSKKQRVPALTMRTK